MTDQSEPIFKSRVQTLKDYRDGQTITLAAYQELNAGVPQKRHQPERSLQDTITEAASLYHWQWYHANQSLWDNPGYFDLHVLNAPHEVFAEIKVADRQPTEDQRRWLDAEARCHTRHQHIWVCVWREHHLDAVLHYLSQPAQMAPPGLWVAGIGEVQP